MSDSDDDTVDFPMPCGAIAPVAAIPDISPQIRMFLNGLNQAVGVNNRCSCFWDRTGGAEFDLLWDRPEQKTAENVLGRIGQFRVQVSRPRFPVDEPTLRYEVRGNDLRIDLAANLPGIVNRLSPTAQVASAAGPVGVGAQPVGFGVMTVFSLFSLIWSLTHMRVTLNLPGNVAADVILTDSDTLRVDFKRGPQLKVVAGLSFDVKPTYLILTDRKAVVGYPGPVFGIAREKAWSW